MGRLPEPPEEGQLVTLIAANGKLSSPPSSPRSAGTRRVTRT
jgi:hypothetical protein